VRTVRFLSLLGVLLAAAGCGRGKGGGDKLHGTWVNKADGVTVTFGPGNAVKLWTEDDAAEGTYTVDWSKSPAHLDIVEAKGGKVETIVEVTGDTLKIEDGRPGDPRPAAFTIRAKTFQRSSGGHPTAPPPEYLDPQLQTELEDIHQNGMTAYRAASRLREEFKIRDELQRSGGFGADDLREALRQMKAPEELDAATLAAKIKELDGHAARLQKARDAFRKAAAKTGGTSPARLRKLDAELKAASDTLAKWRKELTGPGKEPDTKR
jgi:uncharacterized protein (TIGR03067 family)